MLTSLKFYSKDGAVVLQTGFDWVANRSWGCKSHTVHLEDGERVIGYKSSSRPNSVYYYWAYHYDFQLIIGRLV